MVFESTSSLMRRLDTLLMMPRGHGQHLVVSEYQAGQGYELHTDSSVKVGRQATSLLFLNDSPDGGGGELVFPWARPAVYDFGAARQGTGGDNAEWADQPWGVYGQGLSWRKGRTKLPRLRSGKICGQEPTRDGPLKIRPRTGRLVVFFNHDPMGRMLKPFSFHGSCPVRGPGVKRIAQRWYQWFPLDRPNSLGQLLSQVGLEEQWVAEGGIP